MIHDIVQCTNLNHNLQNEKLLMVLTQTKLINTKVFTDIDRFHIGYEIPNDNDDDKFYGFYYKNFYYSRFSLHSCMLSCYFNASTYQIESLRYNMINYYRA